MYVENGFVTGAVLQGNLHQGLTWAEQGESSFQEFYPIDTPRETIQKDAAKYLSKYGKKPFDETAALDLPGGHRVSEKQQEEFSALFLWKKPNYDFLYVDHAMPYSALEYEEYDKIAEPVYAAVYATPGIPLTKGEVYSLFCNCYYSESVYRSGKKHYAVDFMVRLHAGPRSCLAHLTGGQASGQKRRRHPRPVLLRFRHAPVGHRQRHEGILQRPRERKERSRRKITANPAAAPSL